MSVPKTMTSTPAHIHATKGLMCALMMGRSVSLLRPEYTRYKSSFSVEWLATMVLGCWLALYSRRSG